MKAYLRKVIINTNARTYKKSAPLIVVKQDRYRRKFRFVFVAEIKSLFP